MIRILLADDHQMIREGIKALLRKNCEILICGEAETGKEALDLLADQPADLVLMDINMPEMNGIETTKAIQKAHPNTRVLALTMHQDDTHIISMLEAGASGYLLKTSDLKTLEKAIEQVYAGHTFFPPEVAQTVLQRHVKPKQTHGNSRNVLLTNREKEILRLITEGLTNPEIGEKLFISKRTVDAHRRNLLDKIQAKNTAGLIMYAVKQGLVDIE
ncbi:MAG: response regulator [Cyclobacteriaceae bacterium]